MLSGTNTITVNVNNLNEVAVVNAATFSLPENSANGTTVGTVTFTDQDAGQSHTFAITGGNTGGAFTINALTGVITVATSAALNFEATPTFALTVQVTDNGVPVLSGTNTITINLTNVNETPAIAPQTFSVNENVASGTTVGTVVATDPDAGDTLTYAITGGNTGTAFAINSSTGVITTLGPIDFETIPSYALTVSVTDAGALSASNTITVNINNVNEAPIANDDNGGPYSVLSGQTLPIVAPGVLSNDTDPENDAITVSSVTGTGSPVAVVPAGVTVTTAHGSVTIFPDGHFSYTNNGDAGVSDSFTYADTDTVNTSNTATVTISIVHDLAPVLTLSGSAPTFTEAGGPIVVDGVMTATDADNANLVSATVTITNLLDAGSEFLAANTTGTSIVAAYAAPILTLTGTDTVAHYQQVLRTVTYNDTSLNPSTTSRSISFVANDGTLPSNTVTKSVAMVAVNNSPVVTAGGGSPTYTEDGAAVVVDPGVTVSDVDNTNLASATVTITNLVDSGAEVLAANTAGTSIVASYAAPTLTLTGSDTLAHYQQVLRTVTYLDSTEPCRRRRGSSPSSPTTATRTAIRPTRT